MSVCPGIKRDGSRCTVTVEPPQSYCWWHDPANAEERRRAASKGGRRGGRGRPQAELAEAKQEIRAIIGGVLSGRIERGVGAVIFQGYNTLLKAVSTQLAVREKEELVGRLEALEEALESRQGKEQVGSLNRRLERLEEHLRQRQLRSGHISEASRAREELSRKLWAQMLNTMARIRRAPIDPESWRYEVGKLRGESPISIACHVVALAHLEHEDEEEARRILAEVIEERGIEDIPLWEMVEGMTAALDQMGEEQRGA